VTSGRCDAWLLKIYCSDIIRRDAVLQFGQLNIRVQKSNHFRNKKDTYPGEHPSILDCDIWEKIHALLVENQQGKHHKPRSTKTSLLTGILYDVHGTRYTPTHASKQGRRYRYYTSQAIIRKTEKIEIPTRIPAPDLEAAVTDRILDLLRTPEDLLAALTEDIPEDLTAIYSTVLAQALPRQRGHLAPPPRKSNS